MLILIADSHLRENTGELDDFNKLLGRIAANGHDVCFLGDIMELWIAVPKFENDMHREFLTWCRRYSNQRKVYMLEGNHEFFVVKRYSDCFSGSASDSLRVGSELFCHGDLIQRHQLDHLFFRRMSKSRLCFFLLRFLPGARSLVHLVQEIMRKRSRRYSTYLPLAEIKRWIKQKVGQPLPQNIFLGHFHQAYQGESVDGKRLHCLPAWKERQEIALFDPASGKCSFGNWRELLANKDDIS